ncbi:hypothetical protein DFH09DRAFT_1329584 [Mycena vulgaris]|nr:hypothetical protein DFH09DRAFT_1329584 [Mycena vulgaris]
MYAPVKLQAELAPGEHFVKLDCTGICHTDLYAVIGDCPGVTIKHSSSPGTKLSSTVPAVDSGADWARSSSSKTSTPHLRAPSPVRSAVEGPELTPKRARAPHDPVERKCVDVIAVVRRRSHRRPWAPAAAAEEGAAAGTKGVPALLQVGSSNTVYLPPPVAPEICFADSIPGRGRSRARGTPHAVESHFHLLACYESVHAPSPEPSKASAFSDLTYSTQACGWKRLPMYPFSTLDLEMDPYAYDEIIPRFPQLSPENLVR